jgi:hypothetical protein
VALQSGTSEWHTVPLGADSGPGNTGEALDLDLFSGVAGWGARILSRKTSASRISWKSKGAGTRGKQQADDWLSLVFEPILMPLAVIAGVASRNLSCHLPVPRSCAARDDEANRYPSVRPDPRSEL